MRPWADAEPVMEAPKWNPTPEIQRWVRRAGATLSRCRAGHGNSEMESDPGIQRRFCRIARVPGPKPTPKIGGPEWKPTPEIQRRVRRAGATLGRCRAGHGGSEMESDSGIQRRFCRIARAPGPKPVPKVGGCKMNPPPKIQRRVRRAGACLGPMPSRVMELRNGIRTGNSKAVSPDR